MTKKDKTGKELERRVADAYRKMGAWKVEHDVELAGNQIDVYVELETPARLLHRIAVEAKDRTRPVGIKIVNEFAQIVNLLRGERLIDKGVIVSATGFSKQARNAARTYGIRLLEPTDLDAVVAETKAAEEKATPAPTPPVSPANDLTAVEERAFLERELTQHKRNLGKLRLKLAKYTELEAPIHLLNQIEDEEQGVQRIEQCLAQLAEKPLPAPTPPPTPQPGKDEQLPLVEIVTFSGQRVRGWLIKTLRDPLWQGIGGIVAVLALVVAIGTWFWPDIRPLLFPAMPTAMPTSTWTPAPTTTRPGTLPPTPSEEVVEVVIEFFITKQEPPAVPVKPGATITATVQEIVQIEVKVSTTYEGQEKDLVFTWYTCWTGSRPVKQSIGNPEMLYIAPSEPGADCIVVVVEKGGVLLDRENIFVDVQK